MRFHRAVTIWSASARWPRTSSRGSRDTGTYLVAIKTAYSANVPLHRRGIRPRTQPPVPRLIAHHTDHGPFQDIAHLGFLPTVELWAMPRNSSGLYRRFPTLNAHGPNKAALPADRRSRRLRAIERPLLSWASTSFPGIQRPAYQIRQCPLSGADVDLLSVQEGRTADRPLFG